MNKVSRGPGRPPKIANKKTTLRFDGIINKPQDSKNIVELTYFNPNFFKSIYVSLDKFELQNIILKFTPTSFTIQSSDIESKIFISMPIDVRRFNSYFCDGNYTYTQAYTDILKFLKTKKKDHDKIKIFIERDEQFLLKLILYRTEYQTKEIFTTSINLVKNKVKDIKGEFLDKKDTYPLHLQLNWKMFKQSVVSWKCLSNSMHFIKHPNEKFKICISESKSYTYEEIYDNPKIVVKSDEESSILSVMNIKHLTQISNSYISEKFNMYLSNENPIIFRSMIEVQEVNGKKGPLGIYYIVLS